MHETLFNEVTTPYSMFLISQCFYFPGVKVLKSMTITSIHRFPSTKPHIRCQTAAPILRFLMLLVEFP